MSEDTNQNSTQNPQETVTFLSLGGAENVTRNMYLYEYKDQILIVDCGLGFPDETMLGVDLLLPDISHLLEILKSGKKKIVGMILSHGHEDHIGGLPFILPQLPKFPVYATPFTTALANNKLEEFKLPRVVEEVDFSDSERKLGDFTVNFVHVTHSVPDSANIIIKSPVGILYHGSDYKFDFSPVDGRRTEFLKIAKAADEGILALLSDCLGSDRPGFSKSEYDLRRNFEREMRECRGKFVITTYSSNIARLNQVIDAAEHQGRKVCFVGRSVIKVKQIGQQMGYLKMKGGTEVSIDELKNFKSNQLVLVVAGSQGQENSALTRIAAGEHREIRLDPGDFVVFSSDIIPGNEMSVSALLDMIIKTGAKAISNDEREASHVSGHGSVGDHMLLAALTKPKYLVPISGTYRHMAAYREMAWQMGYQNRSIVLFENGQELIFTKDGLRFGQRYDVRNVYVDEVSGEEVEHFVVRDRERLAKEGVLIILAEIKNTDGQLASRPEIIARGSNLTDTKAVSSMLMSEIEKQLANHKGRVTNWVHVRKTIEEIARRLINKKFKTSPLVLPVVIEV